MTKLLRQAYERASQLPAAEQDAHAERLLAELRADAQWENAFDGSLDVIKKLEADAVAERAQGKTLPLDVERLA